MLTPSRDAEAGVWFVESSDVDGLNAEADTLEELVKKLPAIIADLLEVDGAEAIDIPIELIAHATAFATMKASAEGFRWA